MSNNVDRHMLDAKAKVVDAFDRYAGNSPSERLAFLVGCAGLAICLLWLASGEGDLEDLIESIEFGGWQARSHPLIAWTMRLTIAAFVWRFLGKKLVGFVNKPPSSLPNIPHLHFASPEAALEYAERFLNQGREDGAMIIGIVKSVASDVLTVETTDSEQRVISVAKASKGPIKNPDGCVGQLCAILVGPYVEEAGFHALIAVALLDPSLGPNGWKVRERI